MHNNTKIINEINYSQYIHYLESNLIGLSIIKIFKYRFLSCLSNLLYIEKKGDLSIVENGKIYVKRSQGEENYLLTKFENSEIYSLFINYKMEDNDFHLNNWCVIRHKIFKDFYLVYPYIENDMETIKFIAREGKINFIMLIIIFSIFIFSVIMAIFGLLQTFV